MGLRHDCQVKFGYSQKFKVIFGRNLGDRERGQKGKKLGELMRDIRQTFHNFGAGTWTKIRNNLTTLISMHQIKPTEAR